MPRFAASQEVGSVVAEAPVTARVFERHGIDYCCGGRRAIAAACTERGLDAAIVLAELEETVAAAPPPARDWLRLPIGDLLDHILAVHHAFLRRELPRLATLMEKVERVHGPNHPEVLPELARLYRRLAWDLEQHMAKEEEVLFPAIRALEAGGPSRIHCGHLSSPIRVMEWEHDECGRILARMREVTRDYALPEGACGSFAALYGGLAAMEADLHAHIHLENHLVHPRALALADGACAHGIG